jgi:sensor c-di-GMP phosphodiesterase-like protein
MEGVKNKKLNPFFLLNCIWAAISVFLLLLSTHLISQKERLSINQSLYVLADNIADSFDNFLQDISNQIYALDWEHLDPKGQCSSTLMNELNHFIFSNPFVSAIGVINSKNNAYCNSTSALHIKNTAKTTLALIGPITNQTFKEPFYILQHKIGPLYVQVFLLEQILARVISKQSPLVQTVILLDAKSNQALIEMEFTKLGIWKLQPNHHILPLENGKFSKVSLNYLDQFQIIVIGNSKSIQQLTFKQELIGLSLLILISILLYYFLRTMITRHFSLNRAINIGLRNKNFFPLYQPIWDRREGTCIGAEVLLRWQANEQEIITPDLFIKEVEDSGHIVPITLQIIDKTLSECKSLLEARPDFHIAFNLSSSHFNNSTFFNSLLALCSTYDISPTQIMLEITERHLLDQNDLGLIRIMREMRDRGFSLAVDDFGTGHASIGYLQHFPFNYLKIDQIFIQAIGTGAITETLNESIIHMAKSLKLHIIAEGVETLAQHDVLIAQGVYLMQGWFFASAMPYKQLLRLLTGANHE